MFLMLGDTKIKFASLSIGQTMSLPFSSNAPSLLSDRSFIISACTSVDASLPTEKLILLFWSKWVDHKIVISRAGCCQYPVSKLVTRPPFFTLFTNR